MSEWDPRPHPKKGKKDRKKKVQLPSERYPDAEVVEQEIAFREDPDCKCCGDKMKFSGMHEVCEYVTMTPAIFRVIRLLRQKYRCSGCHGSIKTVPPMPRIAPGSSYSDEMIVDVALSKYCDLIPIERYAAMAGRNGLMDLPPQSLIQLTHYLADFVKPIYDKIRAEVLASTVLHADETPHRMLEAHGGKSWYLWGFSNPKGSSYFEIRNTRSGDVASELLIESKCEHLVTDVFSGYSKAVKETNKVRKEKGEIEIKNVYCNAHARRKFKDASYKTPEESEDFINLYRKIYRLEKIAQKRPPERILRVRRLMKPLYLQIKQMAMERVVNYPSKSKIVKAMKYVLKNYAEMTLFLENADLPIDNNPQERQMRNPVIGRKTWYGNHSLKGARTTAILFTLVESCKLAGVNPREYFKKLVPDILLKQNPKTPREFKDLQK
jgi:transposase